MRISCDLDGVVADMDGALARLAEQEFGDAEATGERARRDAEAKGEGAQFPIPSALEAVEGTPKPWAKAAELPTAATLGRLTARQQNRLWERVRQTRHFWESLDECEPGTIGRLQHLAYDLRWDVLFVTQRPSTAGPTAQVQSQRWLHRHGYDLPSVYTTQGTRGDIAAALTLDAHIDDRLEHCVDVATRSTAWAILVWREADSFERVTAGASKMGIAVVRTANEALDKLEQADRAAAADGPDTSGSSLLSRLKQAFQ